MKNSAAEKAHGKYTDIYKGVYRKKELKQPIVWRQCLKCSKDFPGHQYKRLCDHCHVIIKQIDHYYVS